MTGRTDILVEAVRGDRTNAAYLGEAKIWGKGTVQGHVDQLFKYSSARTPEVMLLYYVKNKHLQLVVDRYRAEIGELSAFEQWSDEGDEAVAIVQHSVHAQRIAVTAVFIHIPPPPASG